MNNTTGTSHSSFLHAVNMPYRGKAGGWSSHSDGLLFDPTGRILVAAVKSTVAEELVIPEGVEEIGERAFGWCSRLRSVSFPASLRLIGHAAFFSCRGLEEVTIAHDTFSINGPSFVFTPWFDRQPPGVVYFGRYAFDCHKNHSEELRILEGTKRVIIPKWFSSDGGNFKGVKKVVLPASVTEFQTTTTCQLPTLMSCRTLNAYEVSPDNPCYSSCEGLLYDKSGTKLLLCPGARETIHIPEYVTEIADEAFHYTYKVKALHAPQRLKQRYPEKLALKSVNAGPGWEILDESEF